MERVTISSSLRFKDQIRATISELSDQGVLALFPNLDSNIRKQDVNLEYLQKVEQSHFEAIDNSQALFVICPNGYVGTLVSVEIGYAVAKNKPIYFSELPEDMGLQAIAKGLIPLDNLQAFKEID